MIDLLLAKCFYDYAKERHDRLIALWASKDFAGETDKIPRMKYRVSGKGDTTTLIMRFSGLKAWTYEFGKGNYVPLKFSKKEKSRVVEGVQRQYRDRNGVLRMTHKYNLPLPVKKKYIPNKSKKRVGIAQWFMQTPVFKRYVNSPSYFKLRFNGQGKNGRNNVFPRIPNALLARKIWQIAYFTDYKSGNEIWSHDGFYPIGRTFGIDWQTGGGKPSFDKEVVAPAKGEPLIKNPTLELKKAIGKVVTDDFMASLIAKNRRWKK